MDPKFVYDWLLEQVTFNGTIPGTDIQANLVKTENGFSGNIAGTPFKDFSAIKTAVSIAFIAGDSGPVKLNKSIKQLPPDDPIFQIDGQKNIHNHANFYDYSHLLPETLKVTGHRLVLDQPVNENPELNNPAVHLIGPDSKILHNHVYNNGTYDGEYHAQKTGTSQAVKAAFMNHVGKRTMLNSVPTQEPVQPTPSKKPDLKIVKSLGVKFAEAFRKLNKSNPKNPPGGIVPKEQPVQSVPKAPEPPKTPENQSIKLAPTPGRARKILLPGQKPPVERPGPDDQNEAAVMPGKSLKIGKSQAFIPCELCNKPQIVKDKFVGCLCNKELAKSITIKPTKSGYQLNCKIDQDAFEALVAHFNR